MREDKPLEHRIHRERNQDKSVTKEQWIHFFYSKLQLSIDELVWR